MHNVGASVISTKINLVGFVYLDFLRNTQGKIKNSNRLGICKETFTVL